jgi:ubiquitin-activating enzyme E1
MCRPRLTLGKYTHLQFIIAAANLHAFNYGLRGETDPAIFKKVADSVLVPEFTPRSGVKIQVTDNEPVDNSGNGTSGLSQVVGRLSSFLQILRTPTRLQSPYHRHHHLLGSALIL